MFPFQAGQGWNTAKGTSKGTVRNETNRNGMKIKSEGSSPDTAFDLRLSKKNRIKLHIERIILLNEFIGLQTISFAESPSIVKSPERSSQNRRSYSLADSYYLERYGSSAVLLISLKFRSKTVSWGKTNRWSPHSIFIRKIKYIQLAMRELSWN